MKEVQNFLAQLATTIPKTDNEFEEKKRRMLEMKAVKTILHWVSLILIGLVGGMGGDLKDFQ